MKVLALTRYSRVGASSRVRIYQYIPCLREHGVHVTVSPLLGEYYLLRLYSKKKVNWFLLVRDYLSRLLALARARNFDLVWIEKEVFPNLPAWVEKSLKFFRVRYVLDLDDAVFHNYDLSSNPFKRLMRTKIDDVMREASFVVCGNSYLAERALTAGARNVEVIPTVIDLKRYPVVQPVMRPSLVIGWIGSPSTVKYLDVVSSALVLLSGEFSFQLRVVGAQFTSSQLSIDCRPWSEISEVDQIQDFDIGIMPLADSPWEQGKCGYKLIQYMACGRPVVASAVGVNRVLVVDGVNGYLATSVDDWVHALRQLLGDRTRRLAFGVSGRMLVEEYYQLGVSGPRLAQIFQQILKEIR